MRPVARPSGGVGRRANRQGLALPWLAHRLPGQGDPDEAAGGEHGDRRAQGIDQVKRWRGFVIIIGVRHCLACLWARAVNGGSMEYPRPMRLGTLGGSSVKTNVRTFAAPSGKVKLATPCVSF
jgi:hypothetical protein